MGVLFSWNYLCFARILLALMLESLVPIERFLLRCQCLGIWVVTFGGQSHFGETSRFLHCPVQVRHPSAFDFADIVHVNQRVLVSLSVPSISPVVADSASLVPVWPFSLTRFASFLIDGFRTQFLRGGCVDLFR